MRLTLSNRGFIVTGNMLLAGAFFIIIGALGFNFFADEKATTTIFIEPRSKSLNLEQDVVMDIFISSRAPINAFNATLNFPPVYLEVKNIVLNSKSDDIWVFEPQFSNEEGFVNLAGGAIRPFGAIGKINIATLTFAPKRSGKIEFELSYSFTLQNNEKDSDFDTSFVINDLNNLETSNSVTRSATLNYEIKETGPPSPDLDKDGNVSISDLSVFLPSLKKAYNESHDFNQDDEVNIKDVSILMSKMIRE